MNCPVYGTSKCCRNNPNASKWSNWFFVNVPPGLPLVYLLGRGDAGGIYRVKFARDRSGDGLNMMISPADLMSTNCDYPHVIFRFSTSSATMASDYHISPSANAERFGRTEVKKLSAILKPFFITICKQDPGMAFQIARMLR